MPTLNSTKKKPAKRKLNVRLLRKIQKHILEEPRRFFMDWFIAKGTPGKKDLTAIGNWTAVCDLSSVTPPCGTAACIAGWVNLFRKHDPTDHDAAARELGLELGQQHRVFNVMYWPELFRYSYTKAKTPQTRAKIAAERIEHLIKTGE